MNTSSLGSALLVLAMGSFSCGGQASPAPSVATPMDDSSGSCGRLWPTVGQLDDYLIGENYDNRERRLRQQLHSQDESDRVRIIQMVRDDFKDNAEVVYVVEEEPADGRAKRYVVVYVRATKSASSGLAGDESGDTQPESVHRAVMDEPTVTALHAVWRRMIADSRYPVRGRIDRLGENYSFLAEMDTMTGAARVEGPPRGTCPDELAGIGRDLIDYARAPVEERPNRARLLRDRARALLNRLDSTGSTGQHSSNARR